MQKPQWHSLKQVWFCLCRVNSIFSKKNNTDFTFIWALCRIAIYDFCLVFLRRITYETELQNHHLNLLICCHYQCPYKLCQTAQALAKDSMHVRSTSWLKHKSSLNGNRRVQSPSIINRQSRIIGGVMLENSVKPKVYNKWKTKNFQLRATQAP